MDVAFPFQVFAVVAFAYLGELFLRKGERHIQKQRHVRTGNSVIAELQVEDPPPQLLLPVPGRQFGALEPHVRIDIPVEHDGVDCVIACMHWGNEYERRPNKVQRQLAGFLRRHGVDLIVGSHPHVVQPYEQDSNGIVLYSLGNFVSNQRKRYCDGGIVATVEVTRSPDGSLRYSLELTPVWVLTPGYRITPSEVGDTLSMPADSRLRYERFMTDTRLLLGL